MNDLHSSLHHHHQHLSDHELLQRYYQEYDNKWLALLLPRYTMLLLGLCMKYLKNEDDAKDAVQQVYEKVILELPRHQVTYFRSWVYIVAKNVCLLRLRQKGMYISEINDDVQESVAAQNADEAYNREMNLQTLEQLVVTLPTEQRQCIELFYLQKKSYQQVAEITGYALGHVKSYIQNGKRNLRLAFQKKQGGVL